MKLRTQASINLAVHGINSYALASSIWQLLADELRDVQFVDCSKVPTLKTLLEQCVRSLRDRESTKFTCHDKNVVKVEIFLFRINASSFRYILVDHVKQILSIDFDMLHFLDTLRTDDEFLSLPLELFSDLERETKFNVSPCGLFSFPDVSKDFIIVPELTKDDFSRGMFETAESFLHRTFTLRGEADVARLILDAIVSRTGRHKTLLYIFKHFVSEEIVISVANELFPGLFDKVKKSIENIEAQRIVIAKATKEIAMLQNSVGKE